MDPFQPVTDRRHPSHAEADSQRADQEGHDSEDVARPADYGPVDAGSNGSTTTTATTHADATTSPANARKSTGRTNVPTRTRRPNAGHESRNDVAAYGAGRNGGNAANRPDDTAAGKDVSA